MSNRQIICIMCPLGCRMEANIAGKEVIELEGNKCKKGSEYARQEVFSPERILTTTVKTDNLQLPLLPVRSNKALPKERLEESMVVIAQHTVSGPIRMGKIIVRNILNTGANIIASKSMARNS